MYEPNPLLSECGELYALNVGGGDQIERELELQQTKEMLARLGKKADNVDKLDKSGREVRCANP